MKWNYPPCPHRLRQFVDADGGDYVVPSRSP
jgi:hypothetical protein